MFDVGFWELIILFGLGLIILGPERLPKVAIQVGNWAGQARRMARTLTTQIRDELDIDVNKPFSTTYTPAKKSPPWLMSATKSPTRRSPAKKPPHILIT